MVIGVYKEHLTWIGGINGVGVLKMKWTHPMKIVPIGTGSWSNIPLEQLPGDEKCRNRGWVSAECVAWDDSSTCVHKCAAFEGVQRQS